MMTKITTLFKNDPEQLAAIRGTSRRQNCIRFIFTVAAFVSVLVGVQLYPEKNIFFVVIFLVLLVDSYIINSRFDALVQRLDDTGLVLTGSSPAHNKSRDSQAGPRTD